MWCSWNTIINHRSERCMLIPLTLKPQLHQVVWCEFWCPTKHQDHHLTKDPTFWTISNLGWCLHVLRICNLSWCLHGLNASLFELKHHDMRLTYKEKRLNDGDEESSVCVCVSKNGVRACVNRYPHYQTVFVSVCVDNRTPYCYLLSIYLCM